VSEANAESSSLQNPSKDTTIVESNSHGRGFDNAQSIANMIIPKNASTIVCELCKIAVNDKTNTIYFTRDLGYTESISVIDGRINKLLKNIPVFGAQNIVVNPETVTLYTCCGGMAESSLAFAIDGKTNAVTRNITISPASSSS
jgi:hypothetical protein